MGCLCVKLWCCIGVHGVDRKMMYRLDKEDARSNVYVNGDFGEIVGMVSSLGLVPELMVL